MAVRIGEKYYAAAEKIKKTVLLKAFGATGVDLVEPESKGGGENKLQGFDGDARLSVHNLMVGGKTSSLIITNSADEETLNGQRDESSEKEDRFYEQIRIQESIKRNIEFINHYLDDLKKIGEALRARIAENMAKIDQNNRWIEEMERTHEAAASAIAFYEKNGFFERDEKGRLKNKDAQRLLDEYIRRTGKTPESDTAISLAIQMQKQFDEQEAERRGEENQRLGEQADKDQGQLNTVEAEIETTKTRIEEIRNSGLSPEEQNRQLKEVIKGIETNDIKNEVKRYYQNDQEIQNLTDRQHDQSLNSKVLNAEDDTAALSQFSQSFNQSAANKPAETPAAQPSSPDNKNLPRYGI